MSVKLPQRLSSGRFEGSCLTGGVPAKWTGYVKYWTLLLLLRVLIARQHVLHAERDGVMANLSVCLSVTLRYCIETNAHMVKLFPPFSFLSAAAFIKFQGELLSRGVKYTAVGKLAIFDRNRPLSRK